MIGFSCTFNLRQRLECSVCGQSIEDEDVRAGEFDGTVFGHKKYAICCCCRQEVLDTKDRNYRARWRRWYKKLGHDTGEDAKILKGEAKKP